MGFTPKRLKAFIWNEEQSWAGADINASKIRLRVTNDENIITWHYSFDDGKTWIMQGLRNEVSGLHHNVFGGFLSLKVGVYSVGDGSVRLSDFRYRAL
ncbi:MAG: hypothetical protein JF615_04590 [Asticcacaulis sp.]|nr:hypothetical protein [Asticcacaulis sp.]